MGTKADAPRIPGGLQENSPSSDFNRLALRVAPTSKSSRLRTRNGRPQPRSAYALFLLRTVTRRRSFDGHAQQSPLACALGRGRMAKQSYDRKSSLQERIIRYDHGRAHVLEHLADPAPAIGEMVRVLKPDAPLLVVFTRTGWLSRCLQLRWRIHCWPEATIEELLRAHGVADACSLPLTGPYWCRKLSLACVGRKPRRSP